MNDEKWTDLKERLKNQFGDVKVTTEDTSREDDVGNIIPEKTEMLEFESPLGLLKIVRVSHPKILDKKSHYHKGSGGAKIEYILSDSEMTHKTNFLRRDDYGEWRPLEIDTDKLVF